MSNPSKPRLSDIAKKNTTDRASKLAGAFLPPPPAAPSMVTPPAELVEGPTLVDSQPVDAGIDLAPVGELAPATRPVSAPVIERPKERSRRSTAAIDLAEAINQPVPEGLRCTRMIMLSDEHHDLLRELAFKFKKPMTAILYNLLEPAHQALQRDNKKGD